MPTINIGRVAKAYYPVTEVNHPASGITTFTYDNLGNVLTKQTANLRKEGKAISYEYDYVNRWHLLTRSIGFMPHNDAIYEG